MLELEQVPRLQRSQLRSSAVREGDATVLSFVLRLVWAMCVMTWTGNSCDTSRLWHSWCPRSKKLERYPANLPLASSCEDGLVELDAETSCAGRVAGQVKLKYYGEGNAANFAAM